MSEPDPPRTTPDAEGEGPGRPGTTFVALARIGGRAGYGRRGRGRRSRWPYVVLLVVAVLVGAALVAQHIELDYYVLTPGVAQPVGPLVTVPSGRAHPVKGEVLLTDVYLTQVSALSYLFDKLRSDAQILPAATVLGSATPPTQLVTQGYLEMAQSQSAAKAAALDRLGYRVAEKAAGAIVFAVVPGSPASKGLRVGQIVTAVDGAPTLNACTMSQALARHEAGQTVTLTVERSTVTPHAAVVPGPTRSERVTLARWPASIARPRSTPACPGSTEPSRGYLGLETVTEVDFTYPFRVSIRTTSIGGPSAGLAMTLGIIDTLSGGHLTGGRTVAATGTIAATGSVGDVGGVPQKTVAVERAGATVFFVPADQVRTARSKATPGLVIYGVRSLSQVLSDLQRLGGSVPAAAPPGS
jgi:Lon-like protease